MSRPSLLSRLYLLLGVLGIGFVVLATSLHLTTERIFTRELGKEIGGDLQLLADLCRRDPGLLQGPRADSLARAVSRYKGYRVTIIAADGDVIGESHVSSPDVKNLEDHGSRPEILQARATETDPQGGWGEARRYSPTVDQMMLYHALSLGPGQPVLRMSAGSATLADFRAVARRTAASALLLFVIAAAVISLWVSRRISRPLLRLRDDARDVSRPLRWDAPFREAEILNEAFTDYADAVQSLAAELRVERDRLVELVDHLEEGIVLLDRRGRIRAANASALALLPLRDEARRAPGLTGLAFRDAVRHEGLARWVEEERPGRARESLHQVDKFEGPEHENGKSDSEFDLLCRLRKLKPSSGEPEILLTLVDVTDFRNLDRAKTDFVANASHELKTPLSSILGYSETLLDGALEDARARGPFLRKIHDNAQRLQKLVQDLLNLSQLESQAEPRVEPLFVRDFVQAAWNNHRVTAEAKGLRFENRIPPGLTWRMEPRDLDLMIGNLVGNAVKYSFPAGKVRVDWQEATRTLGVRNAGKGIPPEDLPRIFERFYRDGAARASREGTGLGLAIVKHAAQRYGIVVAAESRMGEGSRFTLQPPEELVADIDRSRRAHHGGGGADGRDSGGESGGGATS